MKRLNGLEDRYSDLKHWLFDPGESTEDYSQKQWLEALSAERQNWLSGKGERINPFTAKVIATVGAVGLLGALAAENPVIRTLGLAFGLGACASSGSQLIDLDHNEIPDSLEQVVPTGIPTPELEIKLAEGEGAYVYHSEILGITATHEFDEQGNLSGIGLMRGSEVVVESNPGGGSNVIVSGDMMGEGINDYTSYEKNGQKGYMVGETVSYDDLLAWTNEMKLNPEQEEQMNQLLNAMKDIKGMVVPVVMETTVNIDPETGLTKNLGVVLSVEMGDLTVRISGTLDELSKIELLKDLQIASTDVDLSTIPHNSEVNLIVYPEDWKDNGVAWVSPDWFKQQESIAASGERFTLLPDGTIQDGATVVPGLFVDKNGVMTLQVNGESVQIDPAKAIFDDEGGFSYPGYTLDEATGLWEPAVSPAETAAIKLLDQYGVDPETYTLTVVDGVAVGTDKETGKEIFRDGRFEINYAVELAKKDCEPTDFEPDNTRYQQIQMTDPNSIVRYLEALVNDSNVSPHVTGRIQDVLIDGTKKCWGFTDGHSFAYFAYRDEVRLGQRIPIIPLLKDAAGRFIINK